MFACKVVLAFVTISAVLNAQGQICRQHYECPGSKVCCLSGSNNGKCADADSCLPKTKSCYEDADCEGSYCCDRTCRESCVGYSCTRGLSCGGNAHCCNDTCYESCLGRPCSHHSHCYGYNEYCCNDVCRSGVCGFASWFIAVIVLSALVVFGILALCVYFARHRRSPGLEVNTFPLLSGPESQPVISTTGSNVVNYCQDPPPVYQPPQPVSQPPQGLQSVFLPPRCPRPLLKPPQVVTSKTTTL